MTTTSESIMQTVDQCDGDLMLAAETIHEDWSRASIINALKIAVDHVNAKSRAGRRRELKAKIRPEFEPSTRTTTSLDLTPKAKRQLFANSKELFGPNGWNIGNLSLADMTKEDCLAEAKRERSSARGHIRNAQFYEALAEPLLPHQRVRDYWTEDKTLPPRPSLGDVSPSL